MKRKPRPVVESHIVLAWIQVYKDEMRCTRCNCSVQLRKPDEYSDGIPRIELPHDWFKLHSDPNHQPVEAIPSPPPALRLVPSDRPASPPAPAAPPPAPAAPPPAPAPSQPTFQLSAPPAIDEPEPKPKKEIVPTSAEDARILTSSDTYRIACGAPRSEVIAHRRAVLAGTATDPVEIAKPIPAPVEIAVIPSNREELPETDPIDPSWLALARSTYVNTWDKLIWIRFGKRLAQVQPHGSIWLQRKTFFEQPLDVQNKLTTSTRVPALLAMEKLMMSDRLRLSMERSGMPVPG